MMTDNLVERLDNQIKIIRADGKGGGDLDYALNKARERIEALEAYIYQIEASLKEGVEPSVLEGVFRRANPVDLKAENARLRALIEKVRGWREIDRREGQTPLMLIEELVGIPQSDGE